MPDDEYTRFLKAHSALSWAKEQYEKFLGTGKITEKLLGAVLDLAKLDSIYRSGDFPQDLKKYEEKDIEDLRNLYQAIPQEKFNTEGEVLLNPTFGDASRLVGGADADLVIDNTLIDIKTVKSLNLRRYEWRQLIGYSVLADLDSGFPNLDKVGFYYSRFGVLWTTEIDTIYGIDGYPNFRNWFKDNAPS